MTTCIESSAYRMPTGYGRIWVHGRPVLAHRAAWESAYGPIPAGAVVCHHCDNPPCINVDHLFLGSQADNLADMRRKGRAVYVRGERKPAAKLNDNQVREIRARAASATRRLLAAEFGVSVHTVTEIVNRKAWKHVA